MSNPDEDVVAPQPARKRCPVCGKLATLEASPFCSRRCADVDLNRWLGGVYSLPAREDDEDTDADPRD